MVWEFYHWYGIASLIFFHRAGCIWRLFFIFHFPFFIGEVHSLKNFHKVTLNPIITVLIPGQALHLRLLISFRDYHWEVFAISLHFFVASSRAVITAALSPPLSSWYSPAAVEPEIKKIKSVYTTAILQDIQGWNIWKTHNSKWYILVQRKLNYISSCLRSWCILFFCTKN